MSNPTQTSTQNPTAETLRLRALGVAEERLAQLTRELRGAEESFEEALGCYLHQEVNLALKVRQRTYRLWNEARKEVERLRRGD